MTTQAVLSLEGTAFFRAREQGVDQPWPGLSHARKNSVLLKPIRLLDLSAVSLRSMGLKRSELIETASG